MSSTAVSLDIVSLIERIIKLERDYDALREQIKQSERKASNDLEEATGRLWDRTAILDDKANTLVFETSHENGDTVYAHVAVTEVRTEPPKE